MQSNKNMQSNEVSETKAAEVAKPAKFVAKNKTGKHILLARRICMLLVLVAVLASLAFDIGIGTPSSFGVGQFSLLCPLGGIEAMLASASFVPVAALSAGVLLLFALIFGRAWCAWGCPAHAIRGFFKREPKSAHAADFEQVTCGSSCTKAAKFNLKQSLKYIGRDKRTWVFLAVVVATIIAGFPLFCLICPIGLTFGTVGSLWHLIVDKQLTASVLVFPVALAIELVAYRKWCMNLCPIAGLLGVFGQFALRFRPTVNTKTCLRQTGASACEACTVACPEHIDLHSKDTPIQLGACSRCGKCVAVCPSNSVKIKL